MKTSSNKPTNGQGLGIGPALNIKETMIVDSMTHEEVYQELERDRDSIHRWFSHQMKDSRPRGRLSTREGDTNVLITN